MREPLCALGRLCLVWFWNKNLIYNRLFEKKFARLFCQMSLAVFSKLSESIFRQCGNFQLFTEVESRFDEHGSFHIVSAFPKFRKRGEFFAGFGKVFRPCVLRLLKQVIYHRLLQVFSGPFTTSVFSQILLFLVLFIPCCFVANFVHTFSLCCRSLISWLLFQRVCCLF